MSLTFRSSIPQEFVICGRDPDGRTRMATATREGGNFNWDMKLEHPSGRNWQATYHGENILDALGELLSSKEIEFKQDKGRGDRPHTDQRFDYNRAVDTDAPIIPSNRK